MNKYGEKRQKSEEPKFRDPHHGNCEWERAGHRCQMPGAINEMGKWFCAWHRKCVSNPRLMSDFKEFESFLKSRIPAVETESIKLGIPLGRNPWRENPTTLWRRVGGG